MDENSNKLDKETLEVLSYERSKLWSNFLNRVGNDTVEIPIDDMEEIWSAGQKEQELYYSGEEAEEVAEDAEEREDVNVLDITKNLTVANARGILAQINHKTNVTGIVDTEVQRVLEETLPIVEEYKRDWRQAGLECVLNTFDIKKIEEKVGGWMRRNNSIVMGSFCAQRNAPQCTHRELQKTDYETDSDSLHSIDTARYIISSKRHQGIKKRISKTTTTIKSYRLVESKRDELRKKYEYLVPDDTMQILNKRRYHQKFENYDFWPEYGTVSKRLRKVHIPNEIPRLRKQRHLRQCSTPYTSYSSSDDEATEIGRKFVKARCNAHCHCCSYNLAKPRQKLYYNIHEIGGDEGPVFLPYTRESECSCRGADKLCKNARHLANSSAEDWLVENCESPKKKQHGTVEFLTKLKDKRDLPGSTAFEDDAKLQGFDCENISKKTTNNIPNKTSLKKPAANSIAKLNQVVEALDKMDDETSCETKPRSKAKRGFAEIPPRQDKIKLKKLDQKDVSKDSKQNIKKKVPKSEKEESESLDEMNDDTFERDLEKAIKLSKQEYEQQTKRNLSLKMKKPVNGMATSHDNSKLKSSVYKKIRILESSDFESSDSGRDEESHTASKLASHSPYTKKSAKATSDVKSKSKKKTALPKKPEKKNVLQANHASTSKGEKSTHKKANVKNFSLKSDTAQAVESIRENIVDPDAPNSAYLPNKQSRNNSAHYDGTIKNLPENIISSSALDEDQQHTQKPCKLKLATLESKSDVVSQKSAKDTKKTSISKPTSTFPRKSKLNVINESESDESGDLCRIGSKHNKENLKNKMHVFKTPSVSGVSKLNSTENTTFFTHSGDIYNSTAVSNNTATSRQIISNPNVVAHAIPNKKTKHPESTQTTLTKSSSRAIEENSKVDDAKMKCSIKRCAIEKSGIAVTDDGQENHVASTDVNDCTVISSTTDSNLQQTVVSKSRINGEDCIVLYTPNNLSSVPDHSLVNGRFKVTEDHLASFIGHKMASKFMKYYMGSIQFNQSSTVYYIPPKNNVGSDNSASDYDLLDLGFQFGRVFATKN